MLAYKNYSGIVEYDEAGKIFTGEVIGLRDVITFQGRTADELEGSFREAIDFYLEMCEVEGVNFPP
jgi:predicted HicB family RNase H-like nuclease